jgi:hypothetical protein
MHHIRPYRIFTLIETPPSERIASVQIPPRRAAGGVTLLETFVMVAALRVVAARRVFEFGTFLGSTTLNLALNVSDDAEIFTLDLAENHAGTVNQHPADAELTQIHLASQKRLDFLGSSVCGKIITLSGDSTKFDFSRWKDSIDLVFVDGGHDLATVKSDTESALQMARKDRPSCILWHDYRNPNYGTSTSYLDELSQRLDIFHIEDTMLCAWFSDPAQSIRSHLLKRD